MADKDISEINWMEEDVDMDAIIQEEIASVINDKIDEMDDDQQSESAELVAASQTHDNPDLAWYDAYSAKLKELLESGVPFDYAHGRAVNATRPKEEPKAPDEDMSKWPKYIIHRIERLAELGIQSKEESIKIVNEMGFAEFGKIAIGQLAAAKAMQQNNTKRRGLRMSWFNRRSKETAEQSAATMEAAVVRRMPLSFTEKVNRFTKFLVVTAGTLLLSVGLFMFCMWLGALDNRNATEIAYLHEQFNAYVDEQVGNVKSSFDELIDAHASEIKILLEKEAEMRAELEKDVQVILEVLDIEDIDKVHTEPTVFEVPVEQVEGNIWKVGEAEIKLPKWMGKVVKAEYSTFIQNSMWSTGKTTVVFTNDANQSFEVEIVRGLIYQVHQI